MPRDSHVSAPPSHRLRIPGHKPQACLQLRVAASSTRVITPWTPKSLPLPQHRPFGGGRGASQGRLGWSPQGDPGEGSQGRSSARQGRSSRGKGGVAVGRGEQRVTPAMVDPWVDSGRVVVTVEKAGQR